MRISRWLLLLAILTGLACFAQQPVPVSYRPGGPIEPAVKRPRIAIALSGGGARGLAHIGVIRWFEENRIPVDYVAGSSMGAVVGAAYAEGMTAGEMKELMTSVSWDDIMASELPYDQIGFRRKEDKRDYPVTFPLGWQHGLKVPNGLNPGHGIGLFLDRMSLPYHGVEDFDQLPIPFRCVASDFVKGKPVFLKSGSLSQALRASLSFPALLTPVEIDGQLLVDGGLTDNIPTDAARETGAEIVIAIDATTQLFDREDLETLGAVIDQSINVMEIESDRRNLRLADIIIAPELGSYGRMDFKAADTLIEMGYQAAMKKGPVLKPLALSEEEWARYREARNARRRELPKSFAKVEVTGASPTLAKEMEARLRPFATAPADPRKLETELTAITGEGRFDRVGYEAVNSPMGTGLRIRAHQKNYGPPFMNLMIAANGTDVGDFDFMVGARMTFTDFGSLGSELRADVRVGSENLVGVEYYRLVKGTRFFVAPRFVFQNGSRDAFANGYKVATFRDRREIAGFDIGYATGYRSEVRFGYQYTVADFKPVTGQSSQFWKDGTATQLRGRWIFDGQDSPTVPSHGFRIIAEAARTFRSPGVNYGFEQVQIHTSTFVPVSKKGSLFVLNGMGTTFRKDAAPMQAFSLGGLFRLGAYDYDELLGNHYVLGVAGYRREIAKLPPLVGQKVYLGAWYEVGSTFNDIHQADYQHCFTAGIIADTMVGPVAFSATTATSGRSKIRFSLGRMF